MNEISLGLFQCNCAPCDPHAAMVRRITQWRATWVGLAIALALHVADEALTGFLAVYNEVIVGLRASQLFLNPQRGRGHPCHPDFFLNDRLSSSLNRCQGRVSSLFFEAVRY